MSTVDAKRLRNLMDPVNLDICLSCGGGKGVGYLLCQNCRGLCPDSDCRGTGTKSWDYDQCSHCHAWLQGLTQGRDWVVYLCDDGYIGMTSDPDARDAEHDEDACRAIIWQTPPELKLDKYQAFKFEWALFAMYYLGKAGNNYLSNRFRMITNLPPSPDVFKNQPPLYYD